MPELAASALLRVLLTGACAGACSCASGSEPLGRSVERLADCPSASVEGIDVFDGQGAIDWPAVADAGIGFAWIKATQGTYDVQRTFKANWSEARMAGVVRGAYHFFDPTEDGTAQALAFGQVVAPFESGDLPPMVDLECPDGSGSCLYGGASGEVSATLLALRLQAFVASISALAGVPPVLYTFRGYLEASGIDPAAVAMLPLFLSDPTAAPCFDIPAPWLSALFWQYSFSGNVDGVPVPVDRDRFLGRLTDLRALTIPSKAAACPAAQGP